MSKLQEIYEKDSALNKSISKGNKLAAHIASYAVGIMAIALLALVFAQTMSGLFTDPTMRVMGAIAAIAVGSNIAIFLVWRDQLLESDQQFKYACGFVVAEFVLLTMGLIYAFSKQYGWELAPFIGELNKIAVIATLPVVGAEWVVIKALSPASKAIRAENHVDATIADADSKARKQAKLSDAVMTIREQSTLAKVLGDELDKLPVSQRKYFANLIMANHSDELANIQQVVKDFIADKASNGSSSTPVATMASDSPTPVELPTETKNSKHPKG